MNCPLREDTNISTRAWSRRSFLKWMVVAAAALHFPSETLGRTPTPGSTERNLSLYNIHTGENFRHVYWANGQYLSEPLTEINTILRDYRTDEIVPIDPRLLDLLSTIQATHGRDHALHIISGYRSSKTNEFLRKNGHGVARGSLHMKGKAADLAIPGVRLADLRATAVSLKGGGVGYYPGANFIHVDTGRVRYW